MNDYDIGEIPMGFAMILAQDMDAMKAFSNLPESEQKMFVSRAHYVDSKSEMEALVRSMAEHRRFN